ncbi:hypothetical protein [Amycolatopsis sp. NPDC051903]|uniref:hypothetical protein n=1 Tax=Amycolatopsis sp. NPDC051903 TaxID=3363936 RepID=UPI0037B39256
MLSTSRGLAVRDLLSYDEPAPADWGDSCSEDDFLRVCGVADRLVYQGQSTPSGAGMMYAKAIALAAVFMHEGAPRDLARKRRRTLPELSSEESRRISFDRSPDFEEQRKRGTYYGVTDAVKAFWGEGARDVVDQ